MTPIEYLEQRVATLKREQPVSQAGREALAHTIHELNNIILAFRLELLTHLHAVIAEHLTDPGIEAKS